jgi:flagellar basal body-associated protein FliL
MAGPKSQWFNIYYFIIIFLCVMAGVFIWFLFSLKIASLNSQDENSRQEKEKIQQVK